MNKFNIGDIVIINITKERGTIIKINALMSDNENLYEVKVGESTRLYREKYLDLFLSKEENDIKDSLKNIEITDISKMIQDDNYITRIIRELKLETSDEYFVNLSNACRLAKYLILNKVNDIDINTNNRSVINSYIFSNILNYIGINCLNVKIDSNDLYIANLVKIKDLYYYFDITLDQDIYEKKKDSSELLLSSEGLGKNTYEFNFNVVGVIDLKTNEISKLPNNISDKDIDVKVINKMIGMKI